MSSPLNKSLVNFDSSKHAYHFSPAAVKIGNIDIFARTFTTAASRSMSVLGQMGK
jgi:hypothetical protein